MEQEFTTAAIVRRFQSGATDTATAQQQADLAEIRRRERENPRMSLTELVEGLRFRKGLQE